MTRTDIKYGYGEIITRYREHIGWTKQDLAGLLGIDPKTLKRYEEESNNPPNAKMVEDFIEKLDMTKEDAERFRALCGQARIDHKSTFKHIWTCAHDFDHVGEIWISIQPSGKKREQQYQYTIKTIAHGGLHQAICKGTILFNNATEKIYLIHRKWRDSDLLVIFEIDPEAKVIFGDTELPKEVKTIDTKEYWKDITRFRLIIYVLHDWLKKVLSRD